VLISDYPFLPLDLKDLNVSIELKLVKFVLTSKLAEFFIFFVDRLQMGEKTRIFLFHRTFPVDFE